MDESGSKRPRIYVASPLGFAEPTRAFYRDHLLPLLAAAGFEILDPWPEHEKSDGSILTIGEKNAHMIDSADALLAVLDGPDVDGGTASEIGYAAAKRIPVVGVRTDLRRSGEDESLSVNLQVEYFIRRDGGPILHDFNAALDALAALFRVKT